MREFWLNAVKAYKELAPRNSDGAQIELGRVDSPYASDEDAGNCKNKKKTRINFSDQESWTQCLCCGYSGTDDCFSKGYRDSNQWE